MAKPISGMLGFTSKVTESIGGGIKAIGDEVQRQPVARFRPPRTFGRSDVLQVILVDQCAPILQCT